MKKEPLSFVQYMLKRHRAGLGDNPSPSPYRTISQEMPSIEVRIQKVLGIINQKNRNHRMLFFVMYDIEDNKVRRQIVKYLLKKGCTRVQKSIFLADTETVVYNQIKEDLVAVQECYENEDSILVVPISTDYLQAMRIIGKNIDVDVILKNKNTLFF